MWLEFHTSIHAYSCVIITWYGLFYQEAYGGAPELNALNGSDTETDEDDDEAHYDHADDMESSEEEAEKVTARVCKFGNFYSSVDFLS